MDKHLDFPNGFNFIVLLKEIPYGQRLKLLINTEKTLCCGLMNFSVYKKKTIDCEFFANR